MSRLILLLTLAVLSRARGEITPIVEHLPNDKATPEFKFKNIPAPVKDDAAAKAKISIADGEPDPNCDTSTLNDGKLPSESDAPQENFFFNEGSIGGRLLIDLGSAIRIKQVNVYSWHPNTRGPQFYKLYAADGSANGFQSSPKRNVDPEKAGWKLIAAIDTRPKKPDGTLNDDDDAMGGQYGVSIRDGDGGGSIGTYRYLLFVTHRNEERDDWGNTFFSEIDVIDAAARP